MNINFNAVWEVIKDILRVTLFYGITYATGLFSEWVAGTDPSSVHYIVGTFILTVVDKYIHKNEDSPRNGLVPF